MPRQIFRTCCCCDLKTGVILIALFSLGIAAINIYTGVQAVLLLKNLQPTINELNKKDELPIPWKYYDDAINLGWSNIAFFASDLIISVVLLIGAVQRIKSFLTAWMVWTLVCVVYHLSVAIFFLAIWRGIPTFGYAMIFDLIIVVYFLLVVYSFKQEIIQENNPHLPVVAMAGQPVSGYYQPPGAQPYTQQQVPGYAQYPQAAPPPYMYPGGNQQPPPYAQYVPGAHEQKVPLA